MGAVDGGAVSSSGRSQKHAQSLSALTNSPSRIDGIGTTPVRAEVPLDNTTSIGLDGASVTFRCRVRQATAVHECETGCSQQSGDCSLGNDNARCKAFSLRNNRENRSASLRPTSDFLCMALCQAHSQSHVVQATTVWCHRELVTPGLPDGPLQNATSG